LKERTVLDHIILTVSNVERSLAFYEAALKPLNIRFFLPYKGEGDHPDLWGFGDGKRAYFWIKQGKPDPASIHWGFVAENTAKVDEFYSAAISAGARENISPRARVEYYPGYYAADVFDPDGYRSRSSTRANDGTLSPGPLTERQRWLSGPVAHCLIE
jgi:catechol 2,3-dioxygenase-like lactoylglutathione lyase family enzyme